MQIGDYDDYDEYQRRRRRRIAAAVLAAAGVLVAILAIVLLRDGGDGDDVATSRDTAEVDGGAVTSTRVASAGPTSAAGSTDPAAADPAATTATTATPATSAAGGAGTTSPAGTATTDAAGGPAASGGGPVATTSPAPTTAAGSGSPDTTAATPPAGAQVTAAPQPGAAPVAPAGAPVPTLPDGTPVPVVAVFGTDTITLTGSVPSQAAVDRLSALAVANSKTPATVVNNLVVNPGVPVNVGVRVIELNSVRFPPGSAIVEPPHALELERVANVMRALPNVTVLVIGHADQRGTEAANFAISDARARAVVNYLISVGIEADRLSSRAVGATDLLSIDDDETALALNRRTEFIFNGLLIEG